MKKILILISVQILSCLVAINCFGQNNSTIPPTQITLTFLDVLISILFLTCVIFQIGCVIFFIKKKNLKHKWFYILASTIGFPVGVGTKWGTGSFIFTFGFNIPAVSVSWPLNNSPILTIAVYLPIGVFLLISKWKDEPVQELNYSYPSKKRRFTVILVYLILSFIFVEMIDPGFSNQKLSISLGVLWWIGTIFFIYKGVTGQLIGCRRKLVTTDDIESQTPETALNNGATADN